MEMLLWQLRRDGVKLPKDLLDGPHRGWLRLARANISGAVTLHAGLYASNSQGAPPLLNSLTHADVRKMDERGLLIFGLQVDPYSPIPGVKHRQAWFCQHVAAGATRATISLRQ